MATRIWPELYLAVRNDNRANTGTDARLGPHAPSSGTLAQRASLPVSERSRQAYSRGLHESTGRSNPVMGVCTIQPPGRFVTALGGFLSLGYLEPDRARRGAIRADRRLGTREESSMQTQDAKTRRPETTNPSREADAWLDASLLPLEDVARLSGASELPADTLRRIAAAARSDPRFAEHYRVLEALARDAGLDPSDGGDLETAFECYEEYWKLLETDGWEHPDEVLDPNGDVGISYRELAHLARERAEREIVSARELEVRDRLERAWATQRKLNAPVTHFVSQLLKLDDETAGQQLQQAASEYRSQRYRHEP